MPSKKNSKQSEDVLQNSHCTKLISNCVDTSKLNGNSQTESDGSIYLDYSMEIVDPKNTPLKWYPNDSDIKVLIVPEQGGQVLIKFSVPNNKPKCGTVQDIITQLEGAFKNKIIHILFVTDPVHYVRYVIKVFPNPHDQQLSSQPVSYGAKDSSHSHDDSCMNESKSDTPTMHLKRNLQILTTYPIPPARGSVTITMDDLECLDGNHYVNDIIIDFYLKYLVLETLSSIDKERIHLFNSFFYTRLIDPQQSSAINASQLLAQSETAENQHAKVKRWTRGVNIFEKDFVIIPIHENEHWFLTIICYPNMIGDKSSLEAQIQSKCPRILIFESLPALRLKHSEVAQTLKNYVQCEFRAKFGKDCTLTENDLDAISPNVPNQHNASDCALYLFQYAENFFRDYITDQEPTFPLKSLEDWFNVDVMQGKRNQLKKLIIKLASKSQAFKKRRTV